MVADSAIEIRPQPGPQEMFMATPADVAIIGGGAGGGKSYALLLEPMRHVHVKKFGCVILRRKFTQITQQGGLWDKCADIYPLLGGKPLQSPTLHYEWPSGAKVTFGQMQYTKDRLNYDGAEVDLFEFDELQQFERLQFFYIMSRNRSMTGVQPYIRASCNPMPGSWLKDFLSWWIDPVTGFAIDERSGVVRWVAIINNQEHWADTKEELVATHGKDCLPKSVTFIKSLLDDNPKMLEKNPGYKGSLNMMPQHERDRLLLGNWNAYPESGLYFKRDWFPIIVGMDADGNPRYASENEGSSRRPPWAPESIIEALTKQGTQWVRYWDRAGTPKTASNPNPDWTAGALLGKQKNGRFVIGDVVRFRGSHYVVENTIKSTAAKDGKRVKIGLEREPNASGKMAAEYLVSKLAGYNVTAFGKTTSKEEDWTGLSSQAGAGNVDIVCAPWNRDLFDELEALPRKDAHDDQADACAGAFGMLVSGTRYTLQYVS